jgi:hypothetical protein
VTPETADPPPVVVVVVVCSYSFVCVVCFIVRMFLGVAKNHRFVFVF